jgi:hypothetical protein
MLVLHLANSSAYCPRDIAFSSRRHVNVGTFFHLSIMRGATPAHSIRVIIVADLDAHVALIDNISNSDKCDHTCVGPYYAVDEFSITKELQGPH